ncbi:MAG: Fmu (Sun) domain-containing protein [Sediminibacterium sp.]
MRYAHQYVKSAVALLQTYNGSVPLAAFLKQYFAQHKKFGSKDRKYISRLCYYYFRLGHAARMLSAEDAIRLAVYCCNDTSSEWAELYNESWLGHWPELLQQRLDYATSLYPSFRREDIFPFHQALSAEVNATLFSVSHLVQPDLFLRIRPGKARLLQAALTSSGVPFTVLSETALALPNGTNLEGIVETDREGVVQDYSSQRVGALLELVQEEWNTRSTARTAAPITVWDCCAASGGKSILAKDILGNIRLTVSDLRTSILHNLEQRLHRAGINTGKMFRADLTVPDQVSSEQFNLVICDAPCSGSGTWGRTPEQLFFFEEKQIGHFETLQQNITSNIITAIKPGGYLLYITCSVFARENEEMVKFIQAGSDLQLVQQQLIKGYTQKADTMFAALLRRPA